MAMQAHTPQWRPDTVALVGLGVVGRGWLPVFGGRRLQLRLYDVVPGQAERALEWWDTFPDDGSRREADSVTICTTPADAVAGAHYVQESVPEVLEEKRRLFREMDAAAEDAAILASSTSSLDINEIARDLRGRSRCIAAHPFNPPAVLPAVEILATRDADSTVGERAAAFMEWLGQRPVLLRRFVPGYIGNRLQLALMREAIDLVEKGVADPKAVDTMLSEALALRWAVLGTFGTNHCNSDGGIRTYYEQYGPVINSLMQDLTAEAPSFDADMIERFATSVDERYSGTTVRELCARRDRLILQIRRLKETEDSLRE